MLDQPLRLVQVSRGPSDRPAPTGPGRKRRAAPDLERAANASPACPTQQQAHRRSANAEDGKRLEVQHHTSWLPTPDTFPRLDQRRSGSVWAAYRGSGSWQSGMLYHGGAMAGDDHEAGSRGEERWDGFEPTSDETDHAGWLVRCAGCGIRRPDPTPDYCQRCGHPHEVDLARAIEKDLSEYA
jgi:hypothetical protein